MPRLILKTPPATEPITVPQAKVHLRIDDNDNDASIGVMIQSARSGVEAFLKSAIMPTVYQLKLDCFPGEIEFPIGPVTTADGFAINYANDAGADTVLNSSLYQIALGEYAVVRPSFGNTWPVTRTQLDAVTVEFKAGYDDATKIPPAIIGALYMWLGDLFENRESTAMDGSALPLPTGIRNLLMPFVRH